MDQQFAAAQYAHDHASPDYDTGLDDLICELAQDDKAVEAALDDVMFDAELQQGLMVRAFTTGSDVEWARVRNDIEHAIKRRLTARAQEVLDRRTERDEPETIESALAALGAFDYSRGAA